MTRVDLTLRPAPRHPICVGAGFVAADIVEGQTEEFVAAGGSCGNVLAILAWLGWTSYPVARLGRDWAATVIRKEFKNIGVEGEFLSDEKAVQTPIVIQRFVEDKAGKRVHRFSLACPECGGWLPRFRASTLQQATAVTDSAIVPKSFYMDRLSPAALKLAGWARDNGALVVFEPSSIGDERQFQKAVDLCHILKFSHDRLGHMRDLREAQQPKVIVETLAEEGLRVRWRGHWSDLPAFQTPAFIDGAGAGDWTSAGLLHQLASTGARVFETLQKPRLLSALRFGQALAAINCGYEGARGVMMAMTRDQLSKRLTALASRKGEIPGALQETALHESDIPTRLCATCASDDEKSATMSKKAASR
jgi:sugar/nucleoside kinase (ribokinase family)